MSAAGPTWDRFDSWVGRRRESEAVLTVAQTRALGATLDMTDFAPRDGDPLPPGWHWIYFHDAPPRSALAPDGHEQRGDFLPPIPLKHRMWAGGRLRFLAAPRLGSRVRRASTIRSIDFKEGRSGPLAFVTVEHALHDGHATLVKEEQDLVYLDRPAAEDSRDPKTPNPGAAPDTPSPRHRPPYDWTESFVADEPMLFRFSALTFNAHRIHYDRPYATDVEGYPGLVVHGPLLALLLLNAGLREAPDYRADSPGDTRFSYRALQPVFCGEPLFIRGGAIAEAPEDPPAPAGTGDRSVVPFAPPSSSRPESVLGLRVDHPIRGTAMRASLTLRQNRG